MALDAATSPLIITLTQGGADAFVQGSVLTGLTGRQAYNVRAVGFQFIGLSTLAADSEVNITVTRRSKTTQPNLNDVDVIWSKGFSFALVTSGVGVLPLYHYDLMPTDFELPIVEDTIYAQLDSTGTGLTLTAVVRLEVTLDTMSDLDRLNLIARSLT